MPIRLKLLLASLLLAATTAGLGLFAVGAERELGTLAVRVYDEALMSVNYARSAQTGFAALRAEYALAAVRAEVPPPPPSERQRLLLGAASAPPRRRRGGRLATSGVAPQATAALVEAVTADLEIAVERAMTPSGREAVTALLGRIAALPPALAGRPPAAALALLDPLAAQFETLVETTTAEGFAYRAEAEALAARTEQATWTAIGLAMLAALAVTLVLSQAIVPAIRRAARVAAAVAAGRLDTEIPLPRRAWRSETAALLRGLAEMQEAICADRARIAAMAEERQAAQAEADGAKVQALETMARSIEAEADGTLARIGTQMDRVIADANGVTDSARAVGGNSSAVAAATGQALEDTSTVAAATEELSASINEISRLVGSAATVARRAVEHSEASTGTIRGLTEAVGRIGAVSRPGRILPPRPCLTRSRAARIPNPPLRATLLVGGASLDTALLDISAGGARVAVQAGLAAGLRGRMRIGGLGEPLGLRGGQRRRYDRQPAALPAAGYRARRPDRAARPVAGPLPGSVSRRGSRPGPAAIRATAVCVQK